MSAIHDVPGSTIGSLRDLPDRAAASRPQQAGQQPESAADALELSDAARRFADATPIRSELVARVRADIARGDYLSEEKLDAAIDRLIDAALR